MPLNSLSTKATVAQLISLLSATPGLQTGTGNPIRKYVTGKVDLDDQIDSYPIIWVEAGGPGGQLYEPSGGGNTQQDELKLVLTVGLIVQNGVSQTAEEQANDLHDTLRLAMRNNATIGGLVQAVPLPWVSVKNVAKINSNFIAEVAIVAEYLLFEDVA